MERREGLPKRREGPAQALPYLINAQVTDGLQAGCRLAAGGVGRARLERYSDSFIAARSSARAGQGRVPEYSKCSESRELMG